MGWYEFLIILVILPLTSAQSVNVQLPASACNNSSDLLSTMTNLPQCTAEAFFTTLANGLIYASDQFFNLSIGFLTASPDINWFCAPYNSIMSLVESLYTIMLMGLGAYYIIGATDVEGRTRAKIWLKNVIYMAVLLSFSFPIF